MKHFLLLPFLKEQMGFKKVKKVKTVKKVKKGNSRNLWLAGCLVGWLVGWLAGWLAGDWRASWIPLCDLSNFVKARFFFQRTGRNALPFNLPGKEGHHSQV